MTTDTLKSKSGQSGVNTEYSYLRDTAIPMTPPRIQTAKFLHHIKSKFIDDKQKSEIMSPLLSSKTAVEISTEKSIYSKQNTLSPTLIKRKRDNINDFLKFEGDKDEVPDMDYVQMSIKPILHQKFKTIEIRNTNDFFDNDEEDIDSNQCSIEQTNFEPKACDTSYSIHSENEIASNCKRDIDTIIDVNQIVENIKIPSFNTYVKEKTELFIRRVETNKKYSIQQSCFIGLPFAQRAEFVITTVEEKQQARPRISSFNIR